MEEYKSINKYLTKTNKEKKKNNKVLINTLNRILVSSVLLLVSLCFIKVNPSFKDWVNKNVYNTNFSFAKINKTYEKYFGTIFPNISNNETVSVFNEELSYEKKESYRDGVKLTVSNNYLVPILESGIVVFIGTKDNYGETIIIQQVNGIDLWYVGVENSNVKLYDYVEKGNLLGEAISDEIYLYYQKSGEFLNYEDYLG